MLASLNNRLALRVDALVAEALSLNLPIVLQGPERRRAEHVIFDMQLLWDRYVRNVILNAAIGRLVDSDGPVARSAPNKVASTASAAHHLISLYAKKRNEPDWYRPSDALLAAQKLNVANFAKISAALGSTPWTLDELRFTRNFFAHKSTSSAVKLRSEAWYSTQEEISVNSTAYAFDVGGIKKVEAWGDFMKVISSAIW